MEFLQIRNMVSGDSFLVTYQRGEKNGVVTEVEPEEVPYRSIGKRVRMWMKKQREGGKQSGFESLYR